MVQKDGQGHGPRSQVTCPMTPLAPNEIFGKCNWIPGIKILVTNSKTVYLYIGLSDKIFPVTGPHCPPPKVEVLDNRP